MMDIEVPLKFCVLQYKEGCLQPLVKNVYRPPLDRRNDSCFIQARNTKHGFDIHIVTDSHKDRFMTKQPAVLLTPNDNANANPDIKLEKKPDVFELSIAISEYNCKLFIKLSDDASNNGAERLFSYFNNKSLTKQQPVSLLNKKNDVMEKEKEATSPDNIFNIDSFRSRNKLFKVYSPTKPLANTSTSMKKSPIRMHPKSPDPKSPPMKKMKWNGNGRSPPNKENIYRDDNSDMKITSPVKFGSLQREEIKSILSPTKTKSGGISNSISNSNNNSDSIIKELVPEQLEVLQACLSGFNVFFSGSAGSGKSYMLHTLADRLSKKFNKSNVFVTATTGISAYAINGITLHQFAGIIPGDELGAKGVVANILARNGGATLARLQRASVLIVDEVSMLSADTLELLDAIARTARRSEKPLGGLQVVLCGDFYQLPPIAKSKMMAFTGGAESTQRQAAEGEKFCFQSKIWSSLIQKSFLLKSVFRQEDSTFVRILENIRLGKLSEDDARKLNCRVNAQLDESDGIVAMHIFTHRKEVDEMNSRELTLLPGKAQMYKAVDEGDENCLRMLKTNCPAKDSLSLKVGTQVMLLKTINANEGLVNGARGVVTGFLVEGKKGGIGTPLVKFANRGEVPVKPEEFLLQVGGRIVAKRRQIPLDLSWAVSVHKSQGMTVDKAVIDIQNVFASGQAYVAVSRVRSLEGLSLKNEVRPGMIRSSAEVLGFYNRLKT